MESNGTTVVTTLRKEEILEWLNRNLPDNGGEKPFILGALTGLIPDDENRAFAQSYGTQVVRRAIRYYQRWHPNFGRAFPDVAALIDWLMDKAGLKGLTLLENRMGEIHKAIMEIGPITPANVDGKMEIPTATVMKIIRLSDAE